LYTSLVGNSHRQTVCEQKSPTIPKCDDLAVLTRTGLKAKKDQGAVGNLKGEVKRKVFGLVKAAGPPEGGNPTGRNQHSEKPEEQLRRNSSLKEFFLLSLLAR
jgi:hypothetical protein